MNLQKFLNEFGERVAGPEWFPFVGFVDSIHAELDTMTPSDEDRRQLMIAQESLQYGYLENRQRDLFSRLIAAELLVLLVIDLLRLEDSVTRLLERAQAPQDDDYIVASSLAGHLISAVGTSTVDVVVGRRNREIASRMFSLVENKGAELMSRAQLQPAPPIPPALSSIKTLPQMLPGDCLFRRQTKPWSGNPFRDFGHTGLYIGCIDPALDPNDCANHVVVHVVSDKPACQKTTLQGFCNPKGVAEPFWGAYQVDLTDPERTALIAEAFSFVNQCSYSFTKGYKNSAGKTFRCDGFVEHCHEISKPSHLPLSYRGGLCEDENWKTLNPRAMTNSLVRKIASDIRPCCLP